MQLTAGHEVLVHVVVHAERRAGGGGRPALHLVQVEAHEGFVLLGQLGVERRLVLRAERRLLLAEHALADHAHLWGIL